MAARANNMPIKMLGLHNMQNKMCAPTGQEVVLAIFYVFYPIFLRSSRETFVFTPLLFCMNHNDLPTS
jgi:hypothetical protein